MIYRKLFNTLKKNFFAVRLYLFMLQNIFDQTVVCDLSLYFLAKIGIMNLSQSFPIEI